MALLNIRLLGQLEIEREGRILSGFEAHKPLELLCQILLSRGRSLPRETIAGQLWGDSTTAQSKKYLRQALWQLQSMLNSSKGSPGILLATTNSLQLNPAADVWLDVEAFEAAFRPVQGIQGEVLNMADFMLLQKAVSLYRGDLLEGWYHDWCLYERLRLQDIYLAMLDKLMAYCEAHQHYEAGMSYGDTILRFDSARERTHQRLMRLYYLSGDRAAALRQFSRCAAALQEELGVKPSHRTLVLLQRIQADCLKGPTPNIAADGSALSPDVSLGEYLDHLRAINAELADLQARVQFNMTILEQAILTH